MGALVEVGAIGWQHESWAENFYPDELPDEWMLSYYANEFRCVLVPHAAWYYADKESIAQWYEDVHDKFSFIVEFAPGTDSDLVASAVLDRLAAFGDRLNGILFKPHEGMPVSGDKAKKFLRELTSNIEVYVDIPETQLNKGYVDELTQLGCKVCWNSMVGEEVSGACLGIIQSDAINSNLRVMRAEVQKFLDQLDGCNDACLLIGGSPPPVQLMRDTMVILRLLDV